jgi:acetyl esterase/lipase
MVGDAEMSAWLANMFTDLGGIAVNVEYRLAPEHKFPQAVEDAFDALKWIAGNASKFGGALGKGFLVGGESAGADLANVTAHLYVQEEGLPKLTGVYSSIPCGVHEQVLPERYKDRFFSLEQNKNALIISRESVLVVWGM